MPAGEARNLAVFMGAMTTLWSVVGLGYYPVASAVGCVVGVAIGVVAIVAARGAPAAAGPERRDGRSRSVFLLAVAREVVAAVAAALILGATGQPGYILPALALIVALHFFVFLLQERSALHLATGIVGTAASATAIVLMAAGAVGQNAGHAIAAAALATCTAAYGLAFLRLIRSARETTPA